MKTISIGEFIDAIEKNGLPQTFGHYFETTYGSDNLIHNLDGTIIGACAVGQACINLDVEPYNFVSGFILETHESKRFNAMLNRVVALNDDGHLELATIARKLREEFPEDLNIKMEFNEFDYGEFVNGKQKEESK